MYKETKYLVAGDKALVLEFGNMISEEINSKVRGMMIAIKQRDMQGIIEMIPTYRSLMVQYNPSQINYQDLVEKLRYIERELNTVEIPAPKVIEIPIVYGGTYGPDIENVARHNGLSIEEVIDIHTAREYLIYMLGFTPGFPYLGGMDERIATPRLKEPRTKISGGSVGIAGNQTGIYPIDSPGGWQLIGKTPLKLYEAKRERPILLDPGDYIKFVSITEKEYIQIEKAVEEGNYQCRTIGKKGVLE
ncbi:KipI family sensor histidine kinase inhibitor [Anaerosolibacter carboniphilus]|uniref:KipI family sensor histidine kinase inhibitor n=1 Tax=Anaerosolibacter carboniphilus TaxID=1417629 RepID=A0A841KXV5_9FIRM|nr:5-oxoprolinase subunit PxpB [Anaerosolibacter carboniphilus]MBB6218586.1 KipI family sensor histidine kinase inhibitor [Anaerosolibacter carboniphilus]